MNIQTSFFTDEEQLEIERNQLVVKHNSLIQKTRYSLNTQQQKVILYLISKIRPDDDELREYDYDLKDFCRVCGISYHGQNYSNIKESILQLHNKAFWITTEEKETLVSWIMKATIYKNDTRLRIRLDDDLKPFLLHLREQFTAYELSYILVMRSKYSIRLYEYLKSYHSLSVITVSVEELKELFLKHKGTFPVEIHSTYGNIRVKDFTVDSSDELRRKIKNDILKEFARRCFDKIKKYNEIMENLDKVDF